MKLIAYEKQVVNGFNHRLVYEGGKGKRVVVVYENVEGVMKVMSN